MAIVPGLESFRQFDTLEEKNPVTENPMRNRTVMTAILAGLALASCSSVGSPAPNGEAILQEEKLRATPVVSRIEKPVSPTDFREDGSKSCAGTVCVEKSENYM